MTISCKALLLVIICTINEFLLGAMLSYAWTSFENYKSCATFYSRSWVVLWLRGLVSVYGSLFLLLSPLTGPFFSRLVGGEELTQWTQSVRTTLNTIKRDLRERHWAEMDESLLQLLESVALPILGR